MRRIIFLLLLISGIAQAQVRQTGGISFTPQWNFKISGSDTTWQFGNTLMSPQQFPYLLTKWQSDQRYAPIGGTGTTTYSLTNGFGITAFTFNGASPSIVKADTTTLRTVTSSINSSYSVYNKRLDKGTSISTSWATPNATVNSALFINSTGQPFELGNISWNPTAGSTEMYGDFRFMSPNVVVQTPIGANTDSVTVKLGSTRKLGAVPISNFALNADALHKTGNETVTSGIKTFGTGTTLAIANGASLGFTKTDMRYNTTANYWLLDTKGGHMHFLTNGNNVIAMQDSFSTRAMGIGSLGANFKATVTGNVGTIVLRTDSTGTLGAKTAYNIDLPRATGRILLETNTATVTNKTLGSGTKILNNIATPNASTNYALFLNPAGEPITNNAINYDPGLARTELLGDIALQSVTNSLLKTNGANDIVAAVAGTDYAAPTGEAGYIQNRTSQQTSANFNIDGTAVIGSTLRVNGNIGIGNAPQTNAVVRLTLPITGNAQSEGFAIAPVVQSGVTTRANGFSTSLGTQATAFTLGILSDFVAGARILGAGSTVNNHYGFEVMPSFATGAVLTTAFNGGIAASAGAYNFYASGTANNYMNGTLMIGSTTPTTGAEKLQVQGYTNISKMFIGTVGTDSIMVHGSDGKLKVVAPNSFGAGTVTSFSKTDGYGITSSVANSTTTPNHTVAVDTTNIVSKAYFNSRVGTVMDARYGKLALTNVWASAQTFSKAFVVGDNFDVVFGGGTYFRKSTDTYGVTIYQNSLGAPSQDRYLQLPYNKDGTFALTGETDNTLSKTANYTIVAGDWVTGKNSTLDLEVDCTGGAVTITMPSASAMQGKTVYITKIDASVNGVTINTIGYGGGNTLIAQGNSRTFKSNGTVISNR